MGKRLKTRKISSISGVITNSSTQIFEIDITNEFLRLIQKEGITKELTIFYDKSDIVKILKAGDEAESPYDVPELQLLLEELNYHDDEYGLCSFMFDDNGNFWLTYMQDLVTDLEVEKFFENIDKETRANEFLFTDFGRFGKLWDELRKTKSVEEIVDFFEPIFRNFYGMAFYSYADDEGYDQIAETLQDNGYTGKRTS